MKKSQLNKILRKAKKRWNKYGGKEIYEKLQSDPEFWNSEEHRGYMTMVNYEIAEDPDTPADVLEKFANDSHSSFTLRILVARNPSTPISILEKLWNENNVWLGLSVAENPSTPTALLEKILPKLFDYARKLSTTSGSEFEFDDFIEYLGEVADIHDISEDLNAELTEIVEELVHIESEYFE